MNGGKAKELRARARKPGRPDVSYELDERRLCRKQVTIGIQRFGPEFFQRQGGTVILGDCDRAAYKRAKRSAQRTPPHPQQAIPGAGADRRGNMLKDVFLVFVMPFLVLGLLINWYSSWQCQNFEDLSGKRAKYVHFDSCYVEHQGRMMRWDEYKAIQREVLISQ